MSPFRASAAFTEEWEHFDFTVEDGIATVTFSRPDKLNALTFDVYADLRDLVTELPHLGDVRVLVLTGEGRGFCSGGDVEEIIGELQRMSAGELLDFTRMSGAVVKAMRDCPMPIIASVNGVAAGAGAVLALAADLRLLASSAKFSFLFTKVGLAGADMGAAYLLPRLVGFGRATSTPPGPRRSASRPVSSRTRSFNTRLRSWRDSWPTAPRSPTRRPRSCSRGSSTSTWAARSRWRRSPRRS